MRELVSSLHLMCRQSPRHAMSRKLPPVHHDNIIMMIQKLRKHGDVNRSSVALTLSNKEVTRWLSTSTQQGPPVAQRGQCNVAGMMHHRRSLGSRSGGCLCIREMSFTSTHLNVVGKLLQVLCNPRHTLNRQVIVGPRAEQQHIRLLTERARQKRMLKRRRH